MKPIIPFALLGALFAAGAASAATTTPVGYTTQTLAANTFNVVGFNVLSPSLVTGVLTGVSGATVTDSNVNFTTALPAGKMCVIEFTEGGGSGTVQEFVTWNGSDITLPSAAAGIAVGTKYTVRVCPTLQETFTNPTIASALGATGSDIIWVPTGPGTYAKYWKKNDGVWHTTTTGANDTGVVSGDVPLVYIDAVYVQKKGAASSMVLTGEVKKTGSNTLVGAGFNLVSVVPPVGLTLFTAGFNPASALGATGSDIIWVPTGPGAYTKYWKKNDGVWHTTTTGANDAGVAVDVTLPAGVLYQRKSGSLVLTSGVPGAYSSL